MDLIITILVKIVACLFMLQPVIVTIMVAPQIKGEVSMLLYVILGLLGLLCIVIGAGVWKRGPQFFIGILNKQRDIFK